MHLRQVSVALVIALLVAGCSSGSKPVTKTPETPPASTGETMAPTTPPSAQPVVDKADADWPPATASDGIKRVLLKAGEPITNPGKYFMDVTTGQVESWQTASADPNAAAGFTTTADNRWVIAQLGDTTYLGSRDSGSVYKWPTARLRLVSAAAGLLLFEEIKEEKSSGWFRVTDASLKSVSRFSLSAGPSDGAGAVFAPDGKTVVINRNNWPQQPVYLVDVATGSATALKAPPDLKDGTAIWLWLYPSSQQGVDIGYTYNVPGPGAEPGGNTALRRYSWHGEVISDAHLKGYLNATSPDGRLYAWQEPVLAATHATVIQEAASGKPLFRVLGATGINWISGGSGVFLQSETGYYTVSTAGELRKVASPPPGKDYFHFGAPQPSPAASDLFAAGSVVYNGAGVVQREATLGKPGGWIINSSEWSPSGKEISFHVAPPVGKDYDIGYRLSLAPKVQRPPFASEYLLQVKDKAGECLNLRDAQSTTSRVIRCLPTGTKLAAGDLAKISEKASTSTSYEADKLWMWVRTEKGEQGWVAVSTGSIDWAE